MAMAAPAMADFSGSKTVLSGETWNADGDIAETADTVITVNVGGLITGGEFIADDEWGNTFDMNIYGAADIEQLKLDGACTVVVGNGTDAATLDVDEGYMGKSANATITINNGSTMTVEASWGGEFEIRTDNTSYIDLVGTGTLKIWKDADLYNANLVIGNGGTTAVSMNVVGDYDVYSTVPEPATMSLLALGGLAMLRRRRNR